MQCEKCPIGKQGAISLGLDPSQMACGTGEPERDSITLGSDGRITGDSVSYCTSPDVYDALHTKTVAEDDFELIRLPPSGSRALKGAKITAGAGLVALATFKIVNTYRER